MEHIPPAAHWQAINAALCLRLSLYDAPRPPRGMFAFTYQHPELGTLECHLEGEEAEPECGWPARVTLCEAYLRGVAITDRLTADEVGSIEVAAMHPREIEEPA